MYYTYSEEANIMTILTVLLLAIVFYYIFPVLVAIVGVALICFAGACYTIIEAIKNAIF